MTPSNAIEALRSADLTETQIGAAVGASQSTINRIRRGKMQPNYDLGLALVSLAVQLAQHTPSQALGADRQKAA